MYLIRATFRSKCIGYRHTTSYAEAVQARINEQIASTIVTGVNNRFSILFLESKFPIEFKRNSAVIIHKAIVIVLFEMPNDKVPRCSKTIAIKTTFRKIDTASNLYMSLSVLSLPPQIML